MKMFSIRTLVAFVMAASSFLTAWAGMDVMCVTPVGYRVGERGEIVGEVESSVVTISPSDNVSFVSSNGLTLVVSAKAGSGYRVAGWQQFTVNPTLNLELVPTTLDTPDPTSFEIAYSSDTPWIYLVAVMALDDARTLTLAKSPFGEGTIGTNYGTYACQKGDVFKLAAVPKHDDTTGFDHAKFRRWSDGVTDTRRAIRVYSNATYVAEFIPNSWKVTFDAQGGAVVPSSKMVTCDATYGRLPTPVRVGHRFACWSTADDEKENGTEVSAETIVGAVGNHTLYARWNVGSYLLSATSSGEGIGTFDGTGEWDYGSIVSLKANPMPGSTFETWADGERRNPREVKVVSNATYVACFARQLYTVKFDYRNADGTRVSSVQSNLVYGAAATAPTLAECDAWAGHPFKGWSTDGYLEVRSDLVVTASYEADRYTISAVSEGSGSGTFTGTGEHEYGSVAHVQANPRVGSAFVGWADGETQNPRDITVVSNATYRAIFQVATNRVAFTYRNERGEWVTTEEQLVPYGGAAVPPSDTLYDNWPEHKFTAWSSDAWKKVTEDLVDDRIIKAIYDVKAWNVVFAYRDSDGNSVTSAVQYVTSGGSATPPPANVVNNWAGHTFTGWKPDYYVIREDTVITALYDEKMYSVIFSYRNADGEEVQDGYLVPYGGNVDMSAVAGHKNDWTGHEFIRWSRNGETIDEAKGVRNVTSDVKVEAVYAEYATIIYASDERATNTVDQVFTNRFGEVTVAYNTFVRTGYTFQYWTNDVLKCNGGDKIRIAKGEVIRLFAVWNANEYDVYFDPREGGHFKLKQTGPELTATNNPIQWTFGKSKTIQWEINCLERDVSPNYPLGWSKREDASVVDFEINNRSILINDLPIPKEGKRIVLYAMWGEEPQD